MALQRFAPLSVLCLVIFASIATAFIVPLPTSFRAPVQLRTSATSARLSASNHFRCLALRMSSGGPAPSLDNSDADEKEEEEEVPDTVMSDDDLDARIAELGLGKDGGVEDKTTGETVQLTPIERAQKEAARIGTTAIGGVTNAAITALNAIEQPIDEEEWKKKQSQAPVEEKKGDAKTMMDAGVLGVIIPVILVGGGLGLWAIASENDWF